MVWANSSVRSIIDYILLYIPKKELIYWIVKYDNYICSDVREITCTSCVLWHMNGNNNTDNIIFYTAKIHILYWLGLTINAMAYLVNVSLWWITTHQSMVISNDKWTANSSPGNHSLKATILLLSWSSRQFRCQRGIVIRCLFLCSSHIYIPPQLLVFWCHCCWL